MIEQRVRDLVIHHGIGPEDDAEGLVRGILALVAGDASRITDRVWTLWCKGIAHNDGLAPGVRLARVLDEVALARQDKA